MRNSNEVIDVYFTEELANAAVNSL